MNPGGAGASDTSLSAGVGEPIVSIIEHKQRARQTSQKTDEGQPGGSGDFVDLHGFTASVSQQSVETVELLFCFVFVLFCFVSPPPQPPQIETRVLSLFLAIC